MRLLVDLDRLPMDVLRASKREMQRARADGVVRWPVDDDEAAGVAVLFVWVERDSADHSTPKEHHRLKVRESAPGTTYRPFHRLDVQLEQAARHATPRDASGPGTKFRCPLAVAKRRPHKLRSQRQRRCAGKRCAASARPARIERQTGREGPYLLVLWRRERLSTRAPVRAGRWDL